METPPRPDGHPAHVPYRGTDGRIRIDALPQNQEQIDETNAALDVLRGAFPPPNDL